MKPAIRRGQALSISTMLYKDGLDNYLSVSVIGRATYRPPSQFGASAPMTRWTAQLLSLRGCVNWVDSVSGQNGVRCVQPSIRVRAGT
jgi:hypothetical protein